MIDPKRFSPPDTPLDGGYVYNPALVRAIKVALATERPLLLRGKPGTGKTTMAQDFAKILKGPDLKDLGADYYQEVVTSRTEARDLQWRFDAILRLAETQIAEKQTRVGTASNYVEPRALWWGFDPEGAKGFGKPDPLAKAGGSNKNRPAVVLIDEIDKAEPEVANDLLEPFDVKTFRVAESGTEVSKQRDVVLVVTTNDERDLPAAFLRRCIVFEIKRPGTDLLKRIARSHFPETLVSDGDIAKMITFADGLAAEAAKTKQRAPGIAEFLDALRAVQRLDGTNDAAEWQAISRLALWKHPEKETA